MFTSKTKKRGAKIPTKSRLKNIALYYLERFESSENNLADVLKRRVDKYVFENKDYNPEQAYEWIAEIVDECVKQNYVNDERFASFKISSYLKAGKSKRYIEQKLKFKGIDDKIITNLFDEFEYSEYNIAIDFARKKKICAFRKDEESRSANRQKDLATLVRAGFSYDIAKDVLDAESQ